jgi:hypothetical protein
MWSPASDAQDAQQQELSWRPGAVNRSGLGMKLLVRTSARRAMNLSARGRW